MTGRKSLCTWLFGALGALLLSQHAAAQDFEGSASADVSADVSAEGAAPQEYQAPPPQQQYAPPPQQQPVATSAPIEEEPIVDGELPVMFSRRPLTLPTGYLQIDTSFSTQVDRFAGAHFDATASISPVDNLELGLRAFGIQLAPVDYNVAPDFYARFRFLNNETVQIAVQANLGFVYFDPVIVNVGLGMPVWINFSDQIRFQTGIMLKTYFGNDDVAFGFGIPAELVASFSENVYASIRTSFDVLDIENAGDTFVSPLGFRLGGTVGSEGRPVMDLFLDLNLINFIQWTGGPASSSAITLMGGMSFYIGL